MNQKLFTVYDCKSEAYDRPWTSPSRGIAIRSLMDVLKDPQHPFSKWPSDFTLFEIGEYDNQTGTLIPYETKVNLGVLIEFSSKNSSIPSVDTESSELLQKEVSPKQLKLAKDNDNAIQ